MRDKPDIPTDPRRTSRSSKSTVVAVHPARKRALPPWPKHATKQALCPFCHRGLTEKRWKSHIEQLHYRDLYKSTPVPAKSKLVRSFRVPNSYIPTSEELEARAKWV